MRILVGTHIKDTGIVLEQVLGAIAVVHIPVEDQYFLQAVVPLQVSGRDRNIVEKAKAQSRIVLGMVTRGSNQGKAVI